MAKFHARRSVGDGFSGDWTEFRHRKKVKLFQDLVEHIGTR